MQEPLINEALQLTTEANRRGIILRIMGALAFRLHCPKYRHLFVYHKRELSDIDFAAYSRHRHDIEELLREFGYNIDLRHSFVRGDRIIFINSKNRIHVDIFFDKLEMCHTINFDERLTIDYPTIPLAELLLEKLQIVRLAEKDVKDVAILLLEHNVGECDNETINSAYIAKILSDDWGFYYTATTNLEKIKEFSTTFLSPEEMSIARCRMDTLLERIDKEPKTFKWKVRARIGTRIKWYQEVEEEHKITNEN
jgi:hypothetical protein